jgi:hypothetical protein
VSATKVCSHCGLRFSRESKGKISNPIWDRMRFCSNRCSTSYRSKDAAERFMALAIPEPNSGCWLWTGSLTEKGYGHFDRSRAHRFSYELFCGPISGKNVVRHKCDVRCCVNPEHLLEGTQAQNLDDMRTRDRAVVGSNHAHSKLTEEIVAFARPVRMRGKDFAETYGVSRATASAVLTGKRWSHVK